MTLDEYLWRHKLTNGEFARKVGVHTMSVSRYRQNKLRPRSEMMRRIFKATGGMVSPNDFLQMGEDNGNADSGMAVR